MGDMGDLASSREPLQPRQPLTFLSFLKSELNLKHVKSKESTNVDRINSFLLVPYYLEKVIGCLSVCASVCASVRVYVCVIRD